MKTLSAIYKGERRLELSVEVSLAEDTEVLVVIPEEEETEEAIWSLFATAQFFDGYSEADSIYDDL